ncbi:uncharacterized protein DS421_4g129230 [Arachis hypogaea]|uniref:Aminotransferase-like plant mobile domain-containing protein n=1 Tax=Arachis hypogaea TaxID=3818 RepID=A0A445DDU5_ARAHY|nr:uncharacterized protein DS421_4g129230 [Arachis hypogaea]RYR61316.1 hypothetical protein Ahy_A04g018472 [Arachis hypogaea]
MLEWDYELALVSTLIVRWRPKSHTLYVPCEEMTITLHDEEYQLGLNIDGDPVSEYIGGWEHFYKRRSIEDICQQLLGVVPGPMIDSYRPGGLSSLLGLKILFASSWRSTQRRSAYCVTPKDTSCISLGAFCF